MYGAIIVKNDIIVSTGYCGAPRGRQNCCDLGYCQRKKMNIPPGERYELCRAVHAEANVIIAAPREMMLGSTLYQSCLDPSIGDIAKDIDSCHMCKRLIINAGIETVIFRTSETEFRSVNVEDWVIEDDSLGSIGY